MAVRAACSWKETELHSVHSHPGQAGARTGAPRSRQCLPFKVGGVSFTQMTGPTLRRAMVPNRRVTNIWRQGSYYRACMWALSIASG